MSQPTIRKRSRSAVPDCNGRQLAPPEQSGSLSASPAYEVGYGRPPESSRFQPGRSGNPRGRPKGAKCLRTLIDKALDEKVTVVERGRERKMTKREIGARRIANKVAEGDPKLLPYFIKDSRSSSSSETISEPPPSSLELAPEEQSFMETLFDMAREALEAKSDTRKPDQ